MTLNKWAIFIIWVYWERTSDGFYCYLPIIIGKKQALKMSFVFNG